MKKWIVPVILLLAATALITYLRWDDFSRSSVDGGAYIITRTKIDSLQRELWDSQISADQRITVLSELEQSWKKLEQIKFPETETKEIVKEKPVVAEEKPATKKELSSQTFLIIGGIICVILCILIILLLRKVFAKNSIDDLEAQKAALSASEDSSEPLVIEERFRNPKGGFSGDDLTFTRTRSSKRPSIIDEANAYAEAEREREKLKEQEEQSTPQTGASFAFEDSEGIPENRILSTDPNAKKPSLRPTTKERITTALQSLSSALTRPRGIPRDQTMHLRTQSRNTLYTPAIDKEALDMTRFDKEQIDKTMVKRLKSQGCTPGMIAKKMNISQQDVDTLIQKIRDDE